MDDSAGRQDVRAPSCERYPMDSLFQLACNRCQSEHSLDANKSCSFVPKKTFARSISAWISSAVNVASIFMFGKFFTGAAGAAGCCCCCCCSLGAAGLIASDAATGGLSGVLSATTGLATSADLATLTGFKRRAGFIGGATLAVSNGLGCGFIVSTDLLTTDLSVTEDEAAAPLCASAFRFSYSP